MNFMKLIGQRFEGTGLLDLWKESDLFGAKTAEKVLLGKDYEKGMRAHKLTYQAMWEMLAPLITEYLDETNSTLSQQINKAVNEKDYDELANIFVSESFQNVMNAFFKGQLHFGSSIAK